MVDMKLRGRTKSGNSCRILTRAIGLRSLNARKAFRLGLTFRDELDAQSFDLVHALLDARTRDRSPAKVAQSAVAQRLKC